MREFIFVKFINRGLFLTDSGFRIFAMQLYSKKCPDRGPRGFVYLNGYINNFKRRRSGSSRQNHYKPHPTVNLEAGAEFLQRMQHLTDTIDRDRIVHFYEAN
jgi:hypothetical protein